jgi:protein-disulfide isomerase
MTQPLSRASFLRLAAASTLLLLPLAARAEDQPEVTQDTILNDPDSPVAGNPDGDIVIVDFFDYNCPYCKAAAVHLERLVKTDGKIKLIYKEWPILSETSVFGTRLALAATYQDRYLDAHHALMKVSGSGISQDKMREAVKKTGIDMIRLEADVKTHDPEIAGIVRRNLAIARSIGFLGTPGFLVGPFKVNQALNYEGFVRVVADARARMKAKQG